MDTDAKLSMVDVFSRFFSVKVADTPALKNEVYRVRYRVYCEEFKYEPLADFPDKLEFDEYDDISTHCLIMHHQTESPAGCVRLVPTTGSRIEAPLPFEKYCLDSLDLNVIDGLNLDRSSMCEISRLAVDGIFRRRSGETLTRYGEVSGLHLSPQEQRACSLIAVACFLATSALGEKENKKNGFAMMEPFLPRLMNRSGISFKRVGKEIDYHGIRAPYYITSESALTNMSPDLLELYEWVKNSIIT